MVIDMNETKLRTIEELRPFWPAPRRFNDHRLAQMLNKLNVEFTKSRPRHSNDNALAETKNGAVIRKHLGYSHIPQRFAHEVNALCRNEADRRLNQARNQLFQSIQRRSKPMA